jgi:hypothetical protein
VTVCHAPGLDELCANAHLYVQTVIRDDIVRMVPNARFQDIILGLYDDPHRGCAEDPRETRLPIVAS